MKHIVKRAGHSEVYDSRKVYASVYSACMSVREPEATAELIAAQVSKDIDAWIEHKTEVTSLDILATTYKYMNVYNRDAAFIYKHHRTIN